MGGKQNRSHPLALLVSHRHPLATGFAQPVVFGPAMGALELLVGILNRWVSVSLFYYFESKQLALAKIEKRLCAVGVGALGQHGNLRPSREGGIACRYFTSGAPQVDVISGKSTGDLLPRGNRQLLRGSEYMLSHLRCSETRLVGFGEIERTVAPVENVSDCPLDAGSLAVEMK